MEPRNPKRRIGFTLMEIVIVVGIVSLLMMTAMPSIAKAMAKSEIKEQAKELRYNLNKMRLDSIKEGKVKWGTYYGEPVVCYPNGKTSTNRFVIRNDKYNITVRLRGLTGKANIDRPTPSSR